MYNKQNSDSGSGFGRGRGRGQPRGRGGGRGMRWMGEYSLMDVRLVEPALLAFLQDENLHGYGLLEKLDSIGLGTINPSVIYRILREYEEVGLVQSDWDTKETQGPPRRVYALTESGKAALQRASLSLVETAERIRKILNLIDEQA